MAAENGIAADPDREIVITVGAAEALFMAMVGLVNSGNEVIVIEPAFPVPHPCRRVGLTLCNLAKGLA